MPDGRRVLITGIAGELAGRVAGELEERDDVLELYGVDVEKPTHKLRRTEFVRADIRNPVIARILEATQVDTVVHMSTVSAPAPVGGRPQMKEHNVIGAMQLFAACQRAESLRRVVLKSSTAVYGSSPEDPALLTEDDTPDGLPGHGFAKDATEVEDYARTFGRRRDDVDLTILRLANLLGGRLDATFDSFFRLPAVPTVMGYDPRLQFCHGDDAVGVLARAATGAPAGTYNVAGPGVLYLSQCVRLAGRLSVPVPLPLADAVGSLVRRSRRVDFSPEQLGFLRFGRVTDITRLIERFGYDPRYSTREAFEDFVAHRRIRGLIDRDEVARWERELYDFLTRKGQERFAAARRGET